MSVKEKDHHEHLNEKYEHDFEAVFDVRLLVPIFLDVDHVLYFQPLILFLLTQRILTSISNRVKCCR